MELKSVNFPRKTECGEGGVSIKIKLGGVIQGSDSLPKQAPVSKSRLGGSHIFALHLLLLLLLFCNAEFGGSWLRGVCGECFGRGVPGVSLLPSPISRSPKRTGPGQQRCPPLPAAAGPTGSRGRAGTGGNPRVILAFSAAARSFSSLKKIL